MKLSVLVIALVGSALLASSEQQTSGPVVLRRVIKSTPTATNLARIRMVTVRSANGEQGAVTEISSKEAAKFGKRNSNETQTGNQQQQQNQRPQAQPLVAPIKSTKTIPLPVAVQIPATSTSTVAPTTSATPSTTTSSTVVQLQQQGAKHKASERVRVEPAPSTSEVDVLVNSSSWQMLTAVEAPAAMLIASGVRQPISTNKDLQAAASSEYAVEETHGNDVLRSHAGATKGSSAARYSQQQSSETGETFSRLRQQTRAQQSFYYPQQARTAGKTAPIKAATKTHWYQAPVTTARPAPIIEQQQQFSENYVEQSADYGAAPAGQAEPFAFDFKTQDQSGNGQYRKEESDKNGVVHGSYGYTDANGIYRHVEYVADHNGFRANIKSNEPGLHGETQPASIQMAKGEAPSFAADNTNSNTNNDWSSSANNVARESSANLALTPPEFESSHKPEDNLRTRRHFRN